MDRRVVLYGEDDENDAFFMQRAFTNGAAELRVVSNGALITDYLLGVKSFKDRSSHPFPALVMLDLKIPVMTGREVLKWIRGRRGFDALPVLIFTSSTQHSDLEFCAANGANGYFVKPARADQLPELMPAILSATFAPRQGSHLKFSGNQLLREDAHQRPGIRDVTR
jgi:CheY-like chemotaxis protein